jgi:hypothetical protein
MYRAVLDLELWRWWWQCGMQECWTASAREDVMLLDENQERNSCMSTLLMNKGIVAKDNLDEWLLIAMIAAIIYHHRFNVSPLPLSCCCWATETYFL